jgi:hypothetical protein
MTDWSSVAFTQPYGSEGPVAGGAAAAQRFERSEWEAVKWMGQQEMGREPT